MSRIGLVLDRPALSPQLVELARRLQADGHEVVAIVQHLPAPATAPIWVRATNLFRPSKVRSLTQRLTSRLFERLELRALGPAREVLETAPLPNGMAVIDTQPELSPSRLIVRHTPGDLQRLREADFDLLIRGNANILKGGVLTVARHGILSLHHGDNRVNRGGPAAFWEVYYRWAATGYIVQRLTEELDGGHVLRRGNRPTASRYLANLASIAAGSTEDLIEVAQLILAGRPPEPEPVVLYGGPIFKAPSTRQIVRMLGRLVLAKAVWIFNRIMARERHWNVAVVPGPWNSLSTRKSFALPAPPHSFVADPFVVEREGRAVIFAELFDYREGKGKIVAYEVSRTGAQALGIVLEEPFHLSFPCLIEDEGELYMLPESEQANEVRLYRCVEFPNNWTLDAVLLPNSRAVDCLPFRRNDAWWMIVGETAPHAKGVRPLLYRANRLCGPWERCLDGPISGEMMEARNGGYVTEGSELFRVIQQSSFDNYGSGVRIARVEEVGQTGYRETVVAHMRPSHLPGIRGGHHLHASPDWSVFDYWSFKSFRLARK